MSEAAALFGVAFQGQSSWGFLWEVQLACDAADESVGAVLQKGALMLSALMLGALHAAQTGVFCGHTSFCQLRVSGFAGSVVLDALLQQVSSFSHNQHIRFFFRYTFISLVFLINVSKSLPVLHSA